MSGSPELLAASNRNLLILTFESLLETYCGLDLWILGMLEPLAADPLPLALTLNPSLNYWHLGFRQCGAAGGQEYAAAGRAF